MPCLSLIFKGEVEISFNDLTEIYNEISDDPDKFKIEVSRQNGVINFEKIYKSKLCYNTIKKIKEN